jgi:hypothetical protein
MEVSPWLHQSGFRCWITSLRCPIRVSIKVLYPLPEILLLVAATIAGADDFVETALRGTEHLAFLKRFSISNDSTPGGQPATAMARHCGEVSRNKASADAYELCPSGRRTGDRLTRLTAMS